MTETQRIGIVLAALVGDRGPRGVAIAVPAAADHDELYDAGDGAMSGTWQMFGGSGRATLTRAMTVRDNVGL